MRCGQFYDIALSDRYSPEIRFIALQSHLTASYLAKQIKDSGCFDGPKTIADIGAGLGLLRYVLDDAENSRIINVDIDKHVLNAAKDSQSAPLKTAFINAGGSALPFREGIFDLVFARYVFQHTGLSDVFAAEINRTLRHGGTLAVIDIEDDLNVFYPALPESSRKLFQKYSEYQAARGGDRNISKKLPSFFLNNGFKEIAVLPYTVVFFVEKPNDDAPSINSVFLLMQQELELVKEELVRRNLINYVEFHKGVNDYYKFLQSGNNLFVSRTEFLITCRKNGENEL